MPVREVLRLPHNVLQSPAVAVDKYGEHTEALAADLIDTMRVSPGCVGLAATQIGVPLRAFSMDVTGHKKAKSCHGLVVVFNPVITERSGPVIGREGCMSVPDLTGDVTRATALTLTGFDAKGNQLTIHADAFEARAIEHEVDHLDGLVFLDRITGGGGVFPRKVYR